MFEKNNYKNKLQLIILSLLLLTSFVSAESAQVQLKITPSQPSEDGWYDNAQATFTLIEDGRERPSTNTLYCLDVENKCEPKTKYQAPIQLKHMHYLRYYTPSIDDSQVYSFGPLKIDSTPPISRITYTNAPNLNGWLSTGTSIQITSEDLETSANQKQNTKHQFN